MKVLISGCLLGHDVRWNGANKHAPEIVEWAESEGIHLVPVCPEDMLYGTPRAPIKLTLVGQDVHAVVGGEDVFENLRTTCRSIQNDHPDAVGFIGMGGSPTCGIGVGVKKLGTTIKGAFHQVAEMPTTDINQLKSTKTREMFLQRIKKYRSSCARFV